MLPGRIDIKSVEPIVVEFPLRGEWIAPNTPGYKIPSHGTDQLAQTYAYDFMQIDWQYPKRLRCFKKSTISALLFGIPLCQCLGWSQPIYAPFNGEVIEAEDGVKERDPVHLLRDLSFLLKNSVFFKLSENNVDIKSVIGNYIILKGTDCYSFFAHAQTGSIVVKAGDFIEAGQQLANVGHAGNSTAPHLHFHLMDGPILATAKGVPCCFREYELFQDGGWRNVSNGIPGKYDRIRLI